jgi:hypothetical protein
MFASVVCLGKPALQLPLKNQLEENCPVQSVWARVETVDAAKTAIVASNVDKTNLQPVRAGDVAPGRGPVDHGGRGSPRISASNPSGKANDKKMNPLQLRSSPRRGGVGNLDAPTGAASTTIRASGGRGDDRYEEGGGCARPQPRHRARSARPLPVSIGPIRFNGQAGHAKPLPRRANVSEIPGGANAATTATVLDSGHGRKQRYRDGGKEAGRNSRLAKPLRREASPSRKQCLWPPTR